MQENTGKGARCASSRFFASSLQFISGIAICGLSFLAACGGGGGSKPPAPPTLVSVSLSPQNGSVAAGLTQQYKATGNYSDGTSQALTTVTWATSNTAIATVNSSGLVTTLKQGTVSISATTGSMSGNTSLTVDPANLASISVSPQSASVTTGQTEQFAASGTYTDGSTQTLSNITWTSATTSVATISSTGLATGVAAGTSTIEATSSSVSGSATLTVTAPVIPAVSYVLGATFASGGTSPQGVVVADFNGDGKPDIAVSNQGTNTIAVFLNDGSGNFGAPIIRTVQLNSSLGLNIGAIAVGDFNEDGKPDLVVGTVAGSQVSMVLLGNGDGSFSQQPPIPNSFGFLEVKAVDLNGDGHQDLVFAGNGSMSVSLGKGDGTFAAPTNLTGGSLPGTYFGLAVADFNGDGKLDVAAIDYGYYSGTLDFWSGNGDGTFATGTSTNLSLSFPCSLASGDFNGDEKQDLLIGYPNSAFIMLGNGDGTFTVGVSNLEFVYSNGLTTTSNRIVVFATPLTKDGKIDAVTTDFAVGTLQIAFNGALGQVPPANGIFSFALAPGISFIAAGDLNGDGVLDVVVINYTTSQVTTVLSKTQ
jgi:uncharacterized protein YjdB